MIDNCCFNVIVAILVASSIVRAIPIPTEYSHQLPPDKTNLLFNLPFLEFKNGGVRVNFGGYHAEAGLGGLLGDSRTGGGLYAGAGTPFGAHASANLGGNVNGENGSSAGGGLHARAGLGNGGPESAAGIGGNIDGADSSASNGRIYSMKSQGGKTKIVFKNIGGDEKTSIQRIPNVNDESITSEVQVKTTKGTNNENEMVRREIALSDEQVDVMKTSQLPASTMNTYQTQRCRRKRRCNNITKTIIHQHIPLSQIPTEEYTVEKYIPTYAQSPANSKLLGTLTAENARYAENVDGPGPTSKTLQPPPHQQPRSATFFDDIFNIPISTLKSVNQLLNNKAG